MQDIKIQLKQIIHDLYGLNFEPDLTPSPDNIDADYSTNAPLKLAKDLHKPPMEIAKELVEAFISAKGGFRSAAARGLAREPRGDGSERRDPKSEYLELSKDSHIARLVARIDEESHRFAITYHSLLKRKTMLK